MLPVERVLEVMDEFEGGIDHINGTGGCFMTAREACSPVTDIAVGLFNGDGKVFACEEAV